MTDRRLTGVPGSGLIIAAPASGSGKTLITLGLLRHLRNSGVDVISAKAGPDYIDPAFHAAATGRACHNLDSWAMRDVTLAEIAGVTLETHAKESPLPLSGDAFILRARPRQHRGRAVPRIRGPPASHRRLVVGRAVVQPPVV